MHRFRTVCPICLGADMITEFRFGSGFRVYCEKDGTTTSWYDRLEDAQEEWDLIIGVER